jgi:raffinose/stachyose/melibiose transport system substrate-binding protein
MKHNVNRLLAVVLCLVMVFALTACAQKTTTATTQGQIYKGITLRVDDIWTPNEQMGVWFRDAIKAFQDETGAVLEENYTENTSYQSKVKALIAANDIGEVGFTWGGAFSQQFLDAGMMQFLGADFASLKDQLTNAALWYTPNNEVYAVSTSGWTMPVFYNKKVFEANNLTFPETWDQLINVCKVLKAAGITPFSVNGAASNGWLFDIIQYRMYGPDAIMDAFSGKKTWEEVGFKEVAKKLQELADAGAFLPGFDVLPYDEVWATFPTGKFGMTLEGNYMLGTFQQVDKEMADYDVAPFPKMGINTDGDKIVMGGCSDAFFVSKNATGDKRAAAVAFIKSLLDPKQQALMSVAAGTMPVNKNTVLDATKVNHLFNGIVKIFAVPTNIVLNVQENRAPNTAYQDILRSKMYNPLLNKTITPDQFLTQFVQTYEQAMQK